MTRTASQQISVPRVRPYFGRLWHGWRDQRSLAQARRLVPEAVTLLEWAPGAPRPDGWSVLWSRWTETGVAVMGLGQAGASPAVVLKAGRTKAGIKGLRAESTALARLHADVRLVDWRGVIPRTVVEGELAGWYFVVQNALSGVEAKVLAPESGQRALGAAAATLRSLHESTTAVTVADETYLERAIEQPLEYVRRAARSELIARRGEVLSRLTDELLTSLSGRTLRTSWIHGDYWLGNLLVSPDGTRVTGIVDWGMAAPGELPLHDVLHLVLHVRQATQRCELGDVVCGVLDGAGWSNWERDLLSAADPDADALEAGTRPLVLLYWLRRLKLIFDQERGHALNPVWVAWNVDRVLRCL